jgi:hypothetical protein
VLTGEAAASCCCSHVIITDIEGTPTYSTDLHGQLRGAPAPSAASYGASAWGGHVDLLYPAIRLSLAVNASSLSPRPPQAASGSAALHKLRLGQVASAALHTLRASLCHAHAASGM